MIDHARLAASEATNPVGPLLRGAAVPALACLTVLALGALLDGPAAAASALVGGAMAGLALAVGPLLHQLCRRLDPSLVLGIVVLGYCLVVALIGFGYTLFSDTSWVVGGFAAAGVLAVGVAWTVGHMRASAKLRQLLYNEG